ncbi:MAG: bacteriohemerythrin [Caldicoprobacter oshimai]|jgi:hemerythrin|uniref:Hemerythrin n=1 Tax=Caldicoprobacter faecalis TaxID=937334 RepID=A0A1I5XFR7_9FIRM|nr:bacteriohemerythrin [Caldicoprobacter faecalis]PZN10675.1 MAG: hemerythrin [Caldicoprobacter oshimai]SFQ30764.1 hemerythrin [Caldicoprobacter faecalis]
MAIKWRKDLEIGIDEIDNQHKSLVEAMNKLLEASAAGRAKQEIGNTLDFLSDYVITHFNYEQEYQKKHNYPKYEEHLKLHQFFLQEVEGMKRKFDQEGATLPFIVQFNKKIVDWFVNHISKADKDYAKYIQSIKGAIK